MQGDSFEVVFRDVRHGVVFCQEVQRRLLTEPWPPKVLHLPHCEQTFRGHFGHGGGGGGTAASAAELVFSGPRVRMGIHVARRGEFSAKLHDMTKHLVFQGDGFTAARAVGDAAHGGQVLLTRAVVDELLGGTGMADAHNPVLERLGCFDLGVAADGAKVHAGFELYQAHPRWGCRMPFRSFDTNPPGATPVEHKSGRPITRTLNIIPLERFFPAPPTSVLGLARDGSRLGSVVP